MKTINSLLLLFLVLSSCSKDDIRIESFEFFENSTIITESFGDTQFPTIENGENLVFDYEIFTESGDERVIDDEVSTSIIFEINPDLNSFEFINQELEEVNCYFLVFNSEFSIIEQVSQGTIMGNQIDNNSWKIDIDITIDTKEINVNGIFNMSELN
jgi:hypothetical protein